MTLAISPALSTTSRSSVGSSRSRAAIISAPATRRTSVAMRKIQIRKSPTVKSRASTTDAISTPSVSTKAGDAYESCKTSYFTCMDQFCAVKNENYRRCSCSNKIFEFDEQQETLNSAATQLNNFNSNIDNVGLTAAQANAMHKASEGELAMAADKSASEQLLSAIMNSIGGDGETKVGNKSLEQLNAVGFDSESSIFGSSGNGQQLASLNGATLYSATYNQCRDVVRQNCSNDALQRAVTAYLMAIENDCSTVSKMIEENRSKMISAVRESGATLKLARAQNRKDHNSSDASECLNAVELAIKDEQVCGEGYKKCLDNGEFIDKNTGQPFSGVANFYELTSLLSFDQSVAINDQKLAALPANRNFVQNFIARNKKFAEPALDKCVEIADKVWNDYLDKAMLEIHYAQVSKVDMVKQGCFDLIHACYVDGKGAVTDFMKDIIDANKTTLQPETTSLTSQLCNDYIQSCDLLFGENIVSDYIAQVDTKDILSTCRNVVKECFDAYGGSGYGNFYNPASGLFTQGEALDWFTLYLGVDKDMILSPCAKRLMKIPACSSDKTILEKAFGGVDKVSLTGSDGKKCYEYGILKETPDYDRSNLGCSTIRGFISTIPMRNTGVATEIYNIISGKLRNNCASYNGNFVEYRYIDSLNYCTRNSTCTLVNPCLSIFNKSTSIYSYLSVDYHLSSQENMCPVGYTDVVDIKSWGICSCWANGGKRPDNSTTQQLGCLNIIPGITGKLPVNSEGKLCPSTGTVVVNGETKCSCPAQASSQCKNGIYSTDLLP